MLVENDENVGEGCGMRHTLLKVSIVAADRQ